MPATWAPCPSSSGVPPGIQSYEKAPLGVLPERGHVVAPYALRTCAMLRYVPAPQAVGAARLPQATIMRSFACEA